MPNALYCYASEIVGAGKTVSVTGGTVDASGPTTNLVDGNPAKACKMSTTTQVRLTTDFGSTQRIDGLLIPIHNIDAAASITLEGNETDSWGSPTLSVAKAVPAYRRDGLPDPLWWDLRAETGYSTSGFRYWSALLPANSIAQAIGEFVWCQQLRAFDRNFSWGTWRGRARSQVRSETEGFVRGVHDLGVRQVRYRLEFLASDAGLEELIAIHDDARGEREGWVLVTDPDVAHTADLVAFSPESGALLEHVDEFLDLNTLEIEVRQVARGVAL